MTPLDHWLSTQPVAVRVLARDYPFGMRMRVRGGRVFWVVSWTASRELILSRVDPGSDWLRARIEDPIWVLADGVRRAA